MAMQIEFINIENALDNDKHVVVITDIDVQHIGTVYKGWNIGAEQWVFSAKNGGNAIGSKTLKGIKSKIARLFALALLEDILK